MEEVGKRRKYCKYYYGLVFTAKWRALRRGALKEKTSKATRRLFKTIGF
jgi:hypothetical protein